MFACETSFEAFCWLELAKTDLSLHYVYILICKKIFKLHCVLSCCQKQKLCTRITAKRDLFLKFRGNHFRYSLLIDLKIFSSFLQKSRNKILTRQILRNFCSCGSVEHGELS